jgi:hypothetical protein
MAAPAIGIGGMTVNQASALANVRQDAASGAGDVFGTAVAPAWTFTVHDYQDPYSGAVTRPDEPPPATRYIGADVEIDNASEQALRYERNEVRLRDASGYEYPAGNTFGDAPALDGRTLNPGERARGWVWYTVAEDTRIVELVLLASSPEFRVAIADA